MTKRKYNFPLLNFLYKALEIERRDVELVERKIEEFNQAKGSAHKERVLLEKKFASKYRDVEKRVRNN